MSESICTSLAHVIDNNPELGHLSKKAIQDAVDHLYYLQGKIDMLEGSLAACLDRIADLKSGMEPLGW